VLGGRGRDRGCGDTISRPPNRDASRTTPLDTATCIMITRDGVRRGHTAQLVVVFCLWRALLLALAAFCPGPGYDTSALILLDPSTERHRNFLESSRYDRLALNLFRWDSAYFVQAAQRDKVYEQEWAFSWAYSKLLSLVARCK
jgi:phosphatidylinositol glycan class V